MEPRPAPSYFGVMTDIDLSDSLAPRRSSAGYDLTPPDDQERARLEADLNPEEKRVLLSHGTEAPFCGTLLGEKRAGVRKRNRLAQLHRTRRSGPRP